MMGILSRKYYVVLFCLVAALLLPGCLHDGDVGGGDVGHADAGLSYIKLRFGVSCGTFTRTNPSGGENGDGFENGQDYENRIGSAVVFLFDATVGVGGDASTPVIAVEFNNIVPVSGSGNPVYETESRQTELPEGDYNVIVVANPGTDKWWNEHGLTLGEVRDHIQSVAWVQDAGGSYSDFLMSSANPVGKPLSVVAGSSEDDPSMVEVDVERMAARVDYKALNRYECADPAYAGSKVEIVGAAILNRFTAGSYLLKRVADSATAGSVVEYLGEEKADGGVATNYVIDPWTALKTVDNAVLSETPFFVGGTSVNAAGLYAAGSYLSSGSDNPEEWSGYVKPCADVADPQTKEVWQLVGYTLENTTARLETAKYYNTGIVFKAKFFPEGVDGYEEGNTFFTYEGTVYPSLSRILGKINGRQNFGQYVSDNIGGNSSAEEIKTFASGLNDDPVGYRDYLLEGVYMSWDDYMSGVLGVDESGNGGPQINCNGIGTRAVLYEKSNKLLRTYYNGECYYIWWLRHSNDGDDSVNGVMEYAVVRNNIYKVDVKSVFSIGGDIPEVENLQKVTVYVNKWGLLGEEILHM